MLHHNYRHRKRTESGATLTLVLVMATLAILIVNTLANTAIVMVRLSHSGQNKAIALTLAEAGIDHAVDQIRLDKNYTGGTVTLYQNPPTNTRTFGSFTTAVTTVDSKNTMIRSVGRMPSGTTREVAVWVSNVPTNDVFNYALASKTTIHMSPNLTVGSTPVAGQGNIHANSASATSITVLGGSVDGRVTTVGGIDQPTKFTATGGYATGVKPIEFPTVDTVGLKAEAQARGTTVANVTVSGGTYTLRGLYTGNLSVSGNPTIIVDGPVYFTGSVTVSGNSTVVFQDGTIVADGALTISGTGSFNLAGTNSFGFITTAIDLLNADGTTTAAATISGTAKVNASVFALNGTAHMKGTVNLTGTVAANKILTEGGVTVKRNMDYSPPVSMGGKQQVNRWQEL